MNSYTVLVRVVLTANGERQAEERVSKAIIYLENSLRYADAGAEVVEGETTREAI